MPIGACNARTFKRRSAWLASCPERRRASASDSGATGFSRSPLSGANLAKPCAANEAAPSVYQTTMVKRSRKVVSTSCGLLSSGQNSTKRFDTGAISARTSAVPGQKRRNFPPSSSPQSSFKYNSVVSTACRSRSVCRRYLARWLPGYQATMTSSRNVACCMRLDTCGGLSAPFKRVTRSSSSSVSLRHSGARPSGSQTHTA
mmetsp:Transcript_100533/g.324257  ORF Transcript_100533/g.324257 Transcript_100533/m.324257 type:complete len:202 (-) Transcript_100533:616-1221(-)